MAKQSNSRLRKEYASLAKNPPPFAIARPFESNFLDCHFILRGPPDSPYDGGEYHGILQFTPQYPFAPPGIQVYTPSGRFQPSRKLCTSFSDFHAGSWNPAWSISTILTGLLSFMLSDEITTGSIRTTDAEKIQFAKDSHAWNLKNPKFKQLFPEYATPGSQRLPNMGEGDLGKPDGPPLPEKLGNPDGTASAVTTLEGSMANTSLAGTSNPEKHIASNATTGQAQKGPQSRKRWLYGLSALVLAALVMRIAGG